MTKAPAGAGISYSSGRLILNAAEEVLT